MSRPIRHYTYSVPGKPQPWRRVRRNGNQHYTHPDMQAAIDAMRALYGGPDFGEDAVRVHVLAEFCPPKSWAKAMRERALENDIPCTITPDIDNVVKLVADALQKVAYRDDRQVIGGSQDKRWSAEERTVITVEDWR